MLHICKIQLYPSESPRAKAAPGRRLVNTGLGPQRTAQQPRGGNKGSKEEATVSKRKREL